MVKLGSKLRAFAKARLMLGVITAVQVAGLVTAAVLINGNDSRQAGKTATGSVRSTDHDGTVGATGSGFARGQEQLKPQADVVELIGQVRCWTQPTPTLTASPSLPQRMSWTWT